MPAETLKSKAEEAEVSAEEALDRGQRAFKEAIAQAERRLIEVAKSMEKMLKESVETLRAHAKPYAENAGQHVDEAQRYVVERVQERPVTATLTALGVGLLLGLVLASRNR